jgi:multidrug efflux pump subunit AcrA (membrane-fusion protein)
MNAKDNMNESFRLAVAKGPHCISVHQTTNAEMISATVAVSRGPWRSEAAAELDQDTARLELKNARTLLERRTIRSPVDGVVTELTLHPGEFAHKQSPVMTIAEINPLNVEVYVPITKYGTIEPGMFGEVVPEDPVGGKYLAEAKIVDRVFDTASSTFGVRLALPNPNFALPAGLKCRVHFVAKPVQQASP